MIYDDDNDDDRYSKERVVCKSHCFLEIIGKKLICLN